QFYPLLLSRLFPDTGDFVGAVANLRSRAFLKAFTSAWKKSSDFPLQTAALPSLVSSVTLSDHASFWKQGYPALMLTDTAYFRNPHYHEMTDTWEKLDYRRMVEICDALEAVVREYP
ncbi:MAG: M28 family peptidase, partial [Elusimicrobiota bacterium]